MCYSIDRKRKTTSRKTKFTYIDAVYGNNDERRSAGS